MIRELDFSSLTSADWVLPRAAVDVGSTDVSHICEAVKVRGEAAVLEFSEQFDGVRPKSLRVPAEVIAQALRDLAPEVRSAIEQSIARLEATCRSELVSDVITKVADGATVTTRNVPMARVGLYVPGGLAPLLSTAVMNAVPARVAGVQSIALASPPQSDGWPHHGVLAACALLGIDEVYCAGGAQALAMFAYGAGECAPVNMITGPGNIYVAAAKRYLQGVVAIDSEAGPSEIAILADDSADPRFVAADLISQAEHDPLAASVLVTDSAELIKEVQLELARQVPLAQHRERITTALSGSQSALVLVADLEHGISVINAYGAEHLEIQTKNATDVASRISNAGAIFVGNYSPVSLGDYVAGSNHVLPTGGSSAHSSGLSVRSFLRTIQVIEYSQAALSEVAPHAVALSSAEDLPSHGNAVSIRLQT